MTTRIRDFDVYDTAGAPLSGLLSGGSPAMSWSAYELDGVATAGPSLSAHPTIAGRYRFTLELDEGEVAEGRIDCGASAASRYVDLPRTTEADLRDIPTVEELAAVYVSGTVEAVATIAAERTDLTVVAGNDLTLNVDAVDSDDVAVDLTGFTRAEFVVKRRLADTTALIEKTLDDGVAIATPANGRSVVTLDPEDTVALRGAYEYEHVVVIPSGRFRVARGRFLVDGSVVGT